MRQIKLLALSFIVATLFFSENVLAQTTIQIGQGTSSSSTRGPIQRSDIASTVLYSRYVHTYTAAELGAAGVPANSLINTVAWELASANQIIGTGDATIKVYLKNSTATAATAGNWNDFISGATLAADLVYNTTNNFPGANGWMPFAVTTPFVYTGGALEVSVEWDCSQVTAPVFNGDGSIKWRWESTAPDFSVAKKSSSSGPSTNISDLKDERANIQITYTETGCIGPAGLSVSNVSTSSADISWNVSSEALTYNWKVVASGAGSAGTAVASGASATTSAIATGLSAFTGYDLFVQSDCGAGETSDFEGPIGFFTLSDNTGSIQVGQGTSSSSSRGPFQRSDINSSTVFSRWHHIYTPDELAAAGLECGASLTSLNWELASSNVMIGSGNATLKIYIKNSTSTGAAVDTWTNLTSGSDLVVDRVFNTTNNFPGANGWMPFDFSAPFIYTGDGLEISVDWDCSQVTTPAFDGDGSLKWRWETTAPDNLVVKQTSSSAPSTNITGLSADRANIQFVYHIDGAIDGDISCPDDCGIPIGLAVNNITSTTADLSWNVSANALTYTWKVVAAGDGCTGTAVASGSSSTTSVTATGLSPLTAYEFYVESNCAAGETSGCGAPLAFLTDPLATGTIVVGMGSSSSSSRGPIQRSDINSSTVFSRWHHIYTPTELAAAGLECGASLTSLHWELASSNVMIGAGDATFKVYIKNSTATMATADTWVNLTSGSTQVVDRVFNTSDNFPGAEGWMEFDFNAPFVYDGDGLEISVDWDCSQVATPAFDGDGSLKWRWDTPSTDALVVKRTSSSAPSTTISDLSFDRANIQFEFNLDEAIDGDVSCAVSCPEDINSDGLIDINDFLELNSAFGTTCTCPADVNGDGQVDVNDFLSLNSAFGNVCQ